GADQLAGMDEREALAQPAYTGVHRPVEGTVQTASQLIEDRVAGYRRSGRPSQPGEQGAFGAVQGQELAAPVGEGLGLQIQNQGRAQAIGLRGWSDANAVHAQQGL